MNRYRKDHRVVDVSILPFFPMLAKKTTLQDTKTDQQASGYDWKSFEKSERNAWDSLKKALKGTYEESVWDHLAGTTSAPFEAGENGQVAVKVIDDRGNELLLVKNLKEAVR